MIPRYIILHHSATKDGPTVSWDAIRRYHKGTMGWLDIGYHFGLERINLADEILTGRMLTDTGAHCKQRGMNRKSIGICFTGDFDERYPPDSIWTLGVRLVKSLMEVFDIDAHRVLGHRELAHYKTCPGEMFDLEKFRGELV